MSKNYKIKKIGLLNFWLYDEEEYDFYGGKLILRGSNGSGKSVTMQSFIPLILDGNKSPDRLDPFGSKERKIEDYVIGDAESEQKEEAISYLYMETYNEEENKYITIGLGFRGRKGRGVESWGFAIKDGKRISKDFFLYKDPANKIPLTKNELKSRLGDINEFVDTTKDYKSMVNRLLFGFPNIETYDEFIKLLLQLRSNKLSKDYKPTNLINVLNSVLNPLSEEDLRPLSEAIEQMNKTKEQMEQLEKNSKSLKDFLRVYKNYNEIALLTKARNYNKASDSYKKVKNNYETIEKELNELSTSLKAKNKRYDEVINQIKIDEETKSQLDNKELKQKIESLSKIEENIKELENKVKELENQLETNKQDSLNMRNKLVKSDDIIYSLEKDIESLSLSLKDMAEEVYFDELIFFIDELNESIQGKIDFNGISMSIKNHKEKITKVLKQLENKEQILLESERTRLEFEKLNKQNIETEKQQNAKEKELQESIMNWQEEFITKINNNKQIKLTDLDKKQIFTLINSYTNKNYSEAKNIYQNIIQNTINEIFNNNIVLTNKLDIKRQELSQIESEKKELEAKDDLCLPTDNPVVDEELAKCGIDYLPLYKCIEFKKNTKDSVMNNIESALLNAKILNSKIILPEDISKAKQINGPLYYLEKTTKKKNNILKYFDVVVPENTKLTKKYIEEILETISVDSEDIVSLSNDTYKLDTLKVKADNSYIQTYIGYLKRITLKKEKIKELEQNIEAKKKEINTIETIINNNNDKINEAKLEENNFPLNDNIEEIITELKNIEMTIEWIDKNQKVLEKELEEIDNKVKKIDAQISADKQGLYIPLNKETYQNVSIKLSAVVEMIQNLKSTHNSYINNIEINNSYKEHLEDLYASISYKEADLSEKEQELNINVQNKKIIKELLETKEYKDQTNKLLKIEEELQSLFKEKEKLLKEISSLETKTENGNEKFEVEKSELEKQKQLLELYRKILIREYNLHYVYEEELIDIDKITKIIINDGKAKKDYSLSEALNNFYASYNHYNLELNDYSLKNITLFNDYETTDENYKTIYMDNTRADVTAMYQGIKVNIIELSKRIEEDIEENKHLISKQDRHLFEDILLNTVGEKIRNRIKSSSEWVKKINNIMATMQENSALGFKLIWKSASPTSDDEVDTREIVRILNMPLDALKETDKEKLTNHFRSKLNKAEELYKDSYVSFYKIIEDVLDYRSWFTFQLLYQRKGMSQKELTDKTFSKFSGGERAKSMYIPLFASVYTKLNMARENSLRVIALDEAFAGVDEANIREMFGILNYLNLDFIINSQVLWGDYDTIEDLSICEIIRPLNSKAITVDRFRWNGKYKEQVINRRQYEEEKETINA